MKSLIGKLLIVIGVLVCVAGVAAGLYMGIWYGLVGGFVAVIEACKAPVLVPMDAAIGVARVLFAGLLGWVTGICVVSVGSALTAYGSSLQKTFVKRGR